MFIPVDKRRRITALAPSLPLSIESYEELLCRSLIIQLASPLCCPPVRHRTDCQEIEDGTAKLLKRKLAKANMGAGLVKDIEVLLDEAKFIVGRST